MIRKTIIGVGMLIALSVGASRPQMIYELRVFALLSVIEDLITGEVYEELYPICGYKNGQYEEARQYARHWDPNLNRSVNREEAKSRSIFHQSPEYLAVFTPEKITTYRVTQIETNDYSCSEVVVGRGDSTAYSEWAVDHTPVVFLQYSMRREDNPDGTWRRIEFKHNIRQFPAVSTNTPLDVSRIKPRPVTFDSLKAQRVIDLGRESFLYADHEFPWESRLEIKEDSVRIVSLESYDLNGDGRLEHTAVIHARMDPKLNAGFPTGVLILWFTEGDQELVPLRTIFGMHGRWSWGIMGDEMYLLDITGDGIPEVTYRSEGYEGWGYHIYEFRGDKFIEVFRGAGVGC